ncbi:MAG: PulJ/GspJ family protein [Bdellovibrionales bacterium]
MNPLLNNRGFTLVEAMVTSALFIIMVMALQTVSLNMANDGLRVAQKSRLQKIARSVVYQISNTTRHYPGASRDARFDNPAFQAFDDPTIADQSCFNDEGGQTPLQAPDCTYQVSSYQVQMASTEFAAGSDVRMMPLYRISIRFKYKEGTTAKSFVITKFSTESLWQ